MNIYKELNDKLTIEFTEEATLTLRTFISDFDNIECQQFLWIMFKATLRREESSLTDMDAINLAGFYERLSDLIEAVRKLISVA